MPFIFKREQTFLQLNSRGQREPVLTTPRRWQRPMLCYSPEDTCRAGRKHFPEQLKRCASAPRGGIAKPVLGPEELEILPGL